ncbi:hypothetical protein A0O28_0015690 [Trichoderma guizhouense]|uniref:Uncharacterized protein n=1 Tax=Trichoderma guizhouense TaxID=1491466 RepID=A0A1T3CBJ3_9HYPO|nr:hypothetical protein A0O28_0015690 [Trichoderma guizhouense]
MLERLWSEDKDWNKGFHGLGIVRSEELLIRITCGNFTPYHQGLITMLNELRLIVFPSSQFSWNHEDEGFYSRLRGMLRMERERLESDETPSGKT